MIRYTSNNFSFEKYLATFTDNGIKRCAYTSDKSYYEDLVSKWGRLENLVFEDVSPTQKQKDRLNWLNDNIDSLASLYTSSCNDYVEHGIVMPDETYSTLANISTDLAVVENTLSYFRKKRRDEARQKRWEQETKGIEFNGMFLRTDSVSQNRVSQLVTTVQADNTADNFDFEKQEGEWIVVTRNEALAIGKAVSTHVQKCFSNCKTLHDLISAAETVDAINSVDISVGWP